MKSLGHEICCTLIINWSWSYSFSIDLSPIQSHQPYISPLSVLERLDPALGVNGTMKSGKEEVAQVVRYGSMIDSIYSCTQPTCWNTCTPNNLNFSMFEKHWVKAYMYTSHCLPFEQGHMSSESRDKCVYSLLNSVYEGRCIVCKNRFILTCFCIHVHLQCDERVTNACEQVCHFKCHQSYHISTNTNKVCVHMCVCSVIVYCMYMYVWEHVYGRERGEWERGECMAHAFTSMLLFASLSQDLWMLVVGLCSTCGWWKLKRHKTLLSW